MSSYLGHEFENGRCILCGAVEKSVREFQSTCKKAKEPNGSPQSSAKPIASQTAAVAPSVEATRNQPARPPLTSGTSWQTHRYRDAYLVAKTLTAFGGLIKALGLCLGALIVIVAIIAATQSTSSGAEMFFSGLLLGIVVAIPIFILGVLVGVQAQVVMAALDTAVHTSPFLTNDDKERVMSF